MKQIRVELVCLALAWIGFAGLTAATTPSSAQTDISGVYGCQGTGVDGQPYSVALEIGKRGDHYVLTWSKDGNPTAYGFGMVSGEVLSVYFETPGGPGLAAYTISKTALQGRYAPLGAEESWPEACTAGGPASRV